MTLAFCAFNTRARIAQISSISAAMVEVAPECPDLTLALCNPGVVTLAMDPAIEPKGVSFSVVGCSSSKPLSFAHLLAYQWRTHYTSCGIRSSLLGKGKC